MLETMLEICESLNKIIRDSEEEFYLVVAKEKQQEDLLLRYDNANAFANSYNWEKNEDDFKFSQIRTIIDSKDAQRTILFFNFQNAIKTKKGLNNVNFLRDVMTDVKKNIIFIVTPESYDRLNIGAMDLFSFMKMTFFLSNL